MQGGYGNGARRRGHERGGMTVRRGGEYGGAWGTPPPPPLYNNVPATMYIRGPPTYPPQQFRGGGHGGMHRGGRHGGGQYGEGGVYDEEDYEYGYRGRPGRQMLYLIQNPKLSGFVIGSDNRTDKGGNQVRLRLDLGKLKGIPERPGGVQIGSGLYGRENGILIDFSEYQDAAPAPPPQPQ